MEKALRHLGCFESFAALHKNEAYFENRQEKKRTLQVPMASLQDYRFPPKGLTGEVTLSLNCPDIEELVTIDVSLSVLETTYQPLANMYWLH